ncbi:MAG: methionine biosynthesis protein MetW [Planctomycetota bacterium]
MNPISGLMRRLHGPVYEQRKQVLSSAIAAHLRPGDRVLDVGCGFGALGAALRDRSGVAGLAVEGLERHVRGGEAIPVTPYAGGAMPLDDASCDVVIVADVVHHEPEPVALLGECLRVSRRAVIVKDHSVGPGGALSRAWRQWRIGLMDWAANAPYGVKCLYDYPPPAMWQTRFEQAAGRAGRPMRVASVATSMSLYPLPYAAVFTPGLQYFAVLRVDETPTD